MLKIRKKDSKLYKMNIFKENNKIIMAFHK